MNSEIIKTNVLATASAEIKKLDGINHMVVPVVAITEGVLNNIFYSADEINNFVQAWNGVPVPVNHPINNAGNAVSANSPDIESTTNIGTFYNTKFENGKLKGEIWINIDKAKRLKYGYIVEAFEKNEMMEISTGLYANIIKQAGIYNGKSYKGVATEIRPDHLALLPNQKGACSIEDGCGALRVNEQDCCDDCRDDKIKKERSMAYNFMQMLRNRISPDKGIQTNETIEVLTNELDKAHNDKVFIHEVKDDKVFYQLNDKLFSRDIISNDDGLTLGDNVDEVVGNTTYEVLNEANGNDATTTTEETPLEKENKVGDIVANYATLNNDEKKQLVEQLNINSLSDDEMSEYKALKAEQNEKLDNLRKEVVANYENLTDEMVVNMSSETLEALNKSVPKPADYSAKNGSGLNTNNEYATPGLLSAKKQEK